jgi:hypothetical protein
VDRKSFTELGVIHVMPSLDESRLFVYAKVLGVLWTYLFGVYDAVGDSLIYQQVITPGGGKIEVDPLSEYTYYTSPGVTGTDPTPTGYFWRYDVATNSLHDSVSAWAYAMPSCLCAPNSMATTPDNRWMVMLGGSDLAPQVLYLYDVEREQFVDFIDFGIVALSNPTVQKMK